MSLRQPKLSRIYAKPAIFWVLAFALGVALVWTLTLASLRQERTQAEQALQSLANTYSQTYAEQLERTIAQIEQLTLSLQYQWEANPASVSLENQLMFGIFPRSAGLHVSILDKDGKGVTSTLAGTMPDASDSEYFKFHRGSGNTGLRVDTHLVTEARIGKPALRFTRRLDKEDSSFNGVIVVWVEQSFLASFSDEQGMKPGDFISIRHENGELLVSEKAQDIRGPNEVHLKPPRFDIASGLMRVAEDRFRDGQARVLAWKKNKRYPLVSYAALSEAAHLDDHVRHAAEERGLAVLRTAFIGLLCLLGLHFTVRYRRRRQQVEEVRAIFRLATDAANEGFYMMRPVFEPDGSVADFIFEECNERGAGLVGLTKKDLIGMSLTELNQNRRKEDVLAPFMQAMEKGLHEIEVRVAPDSPVKTRWINMRLMRSGDGLAMTIRDISEQKEHEFRLVDLANTDSLTGLSNRHWLIGFLPEALNRARARQSMLSILFIDLDGFKDINDSLGHAAGDRLLQAVALRLKSLLRPNDHVVRLGGDEFTVLLTEVAGQAEVAQVAARICQSFHEPFQIVTHNWLIRASVGISLFPQDSLTAEPLLQRADVAMYAAKEDAKGTFRFYDEQLHDRLRDRLQVEGELTQAIIEDQFLLHYQPRVNTQTGKLVGLEALVRWRHPQRGMVPPNDFIPTAEKTGAIVPLGELILKKVCSQLAAWRRDGEPVVPVSVNISARQFNAGGVDQLIASLLARYELAPELLEAELTESAMMNESQDIIGQVAGLNALGITIHVDDFGTGYSSLARLQELNTDVLKIDRAFTNRLARGTPGETLFRSIVSMGKALQMRIVAEGVETREQLELLQELDCDEVQGYLVAKPLPAEAVLECIRRQYLFEAAYT